MDTSKLSTGDKVVLGAGAAMLLFSFLPWFTVEFFGSTYTENAWDYFLTGMVPLGLTLALVAWVVVTRILDVELPDLPIPEGLAALAVAGAAAALIGLRLLVGGDDDGTDVLDRSYGLFLSVLAVIALVAGAFLKFQEDGGQLPGASSSGSGTPTPF